MAFRNYLEGEDDKPYFHLNSLAHYYEKMEGFAAAVENAAKTLNLSKEEIEQRVTAYILENKTQLDQRLGEWDEKLQQFDGSVTDLLAEWVDDGTLTHIIDDTLLKKKADQSSVDVLTNKLGEKANVTDVRLKNIKIEPEEWSARAIEMVSGNTEVNLLTIPQPESVTPSTLSSSLFTDFEGIKVNQVSANATYLTMEMVFDTLGLDLENLPITVKYDLYSDNQLVESMGSRLFLNNSSADLSTAITYSPTLLQPFAPGKINEYRTTRENYVSANRYVHLFVYLTPNDNTKEIEFYLSNVSLSVGDVQLKDTGIVKGYSATSMSYKPIDSLPNQLVLRQEYSALKKTVDSISGDRFKTYDVVGGDGDSNMYGRADDGTSRLVNPYLNQIGEYFGAQEVLNYGVSGCNISTHENRNPLVNRLSQYDRRIKLFIAEGGFNDYATRTPVGTMASRDVSTFYGALHAYYGYLATHFINADIIVMGVWQSRIGSEFGGGSRSDITLRKWADIQREVAEYYSLTFFDAYSEVGYSQNIPEHIELLSKDGLHQSQLFADKTGRKLIGKVNSI